MKLTRINLMNKRILKTQKYMLLCFIILLFTTSCSIFVNTFMSIPNLNVYTNQEIDDMISAFTTRNNVFDAKISYQPSTKQIENLISKGLENRYYVYDKDFKIICLQENSYKCSSYLLNDIRENTLGSQVVKCKTTKVLQNDFEMNLDKFISRLKFVNGKRKLNKDKRFTIVYFWNNDFSKGNYLENWKYFMSNFKNEKKIQFVRISTDLNEQWGLNKNKKIKS